MAKKTKKAIKQEASEMTGIAPENIKDVQLQLGRLRETGILIDVQVKGSSLFTRQSTWAELGIFGAEDIRKERMTKGRKYLISPKLIKRWLSCESKLRQNLKKYGSRIAGFHPWTWIGYNAFPVWKENHEEIIYEMSMIKIEILEKYDEHIDALVTDFTEIAKLVYKKLTKGEKISLVLETGQIIEKESEFIEVVVDRARENMPTPKMIGEEMGGYYQTAIVFTGGANRIFQFLKFISQLKIVMYRQYLEQFNKTFTLFSYFSSNPTIFLDALDHIFGIFSKPISQLRKDLFEWRDHFR